MMIRRDKLYAEKCYIREPAQSLSQSITKHINENINRNNDNLGINIELFWMLN